MITKKHGIKCSKRDIIEQSFYCVEVYSKFQIIGEDHPLQIICKESKFELIDFINRQFPYNYKFQLFKISKLKL